MSFTALGPFAQLSWAFPPRNFERAHRVHLGARTWDVLKLLASPAPLLVQANCGSCLDGYVEHFLYKRVAAIKFQLWTTDAGSLSIPIANVLAQNLSLDRVEIVGIKESLLKTREVPAEITFAKLVGSEI